MSLPLTEQFCIINLGCKVNRVESDTLTAAFISHGARLVSKDQADLVIINTCTVTGEAEKKTRKAVRSALRAAPTARVLVTGCASEIDPDTYLNMDERVSVVSRAELFQDSPYETGGLLRLGDSFRTRVEIKVQDGCDQNCSYCIVHTARGKAKSAPFEAICKEVSDYVSHGVKEIVLTGINLGTYEWEGCDLVHLLESLREICTMNVPAGTPACRIRASSLEPISINERFIDLLAESDGQICRHLHLPLQSGSSKVLKEMNRPYSASDFLKLGERLYEAIPELSLTTDIICGFPGESESEFQETLDLARTMRFSKIHCFPYSMRKGTKAAERKDQIDETVKSERAAELRELAASLRANDLAARRGSHELVLVEGTKGLSESYHFVDIPSKFSPGSLIDYVHR